MTWLCRLALAGALLCPLAAAPGAEAPKSAASPTKYTLRYKFRAGETVRWDVVHRASIRTTVSGTTQTAETLSKSVKLWRIQAVGEDGSITLEHLVESVDMSQKLSGRQEVRYNSQKDQKAPLGFETVAASVGKPLATVTIDPLGKVLKRQRHDVPGQAAGEGQITIPLPEKAVAVGESWVVPCDIEVPVAAGAIKKIKAQQRFTLSAVKTGVATIEVSTQILTPINDPALEAQLVQRESAGTVRFAIEAGRVRGQQMDLDKQVVGFHGEASSLHYVTRFTEELLPEQSQVASPATTEVRK